MFLRVTDVLIDMLIGALRTLDRINQSWRIRSLDGLTHLAAYETALKRIGISGFSFYIGKNSQKLKWRSLTGPEKLLLFTRLNLAEHFPDLSNIDAIQNLWREFYDINKLLSARSSEITNDHIKNFEARSRSFVDNFIQLYPSKHVTPYMHCMMNHVSEFLKVHGSILQFTQHGIEKYNDILTKDFFRSSSHHQESSLLQILQKQNCLEYLQSMGATKKKQEMKCGNCRSAGHNRLTCKSQCTISGAKPFYEHYLNDVKKPKCQVCP